MNQNRLPSLTEPGGIPHEILAGTEPLIRAFQYARSTDEDLWQWSVRFSELQSSGLASPDIRWLLVHGLIEQAVETTRLGEEARSFRRHDLRCTGPDCCFVLTDRGVSVLRNAFGRPVAADVAEMQAVIAQPRPSDVEPICPNGTLAPRWVAETRVLQYSRLVIKRFRVPAANQERILSSFEEEAWPCHIDDPLPPDPRMDSKRRLQATIKSLNRNQVNALIRFRGNGTGTSVCWEYVTNELPKPDEASDDARLTLEQPGPSR